MSQQHSFELDDLDLGSEPTGQKKPQPSSRRSTVHEDRPAEELDPRVALSQEVVAAVFGAIHERRFAVRYWDGTFEPAGASSTPEYILSFERPGSLRRMLLPPSELSIVESFLSGDVNIEGHMEAAMSLADDIGKRVQSGKAFAKLLPKLIALPRDQSSAPKEVKGMRFSRGLKRLVSTWRPGDEKAIQYHYDVSNDFYRLWLDQRMVYTCAYFKRADDDLETAQVAKLDHICRKLRLEPGMRFLDVGCGWGALVIHAAQNYGVDAVGITLSEAQATLARQHIAAAGLSDRCRVELRDYRDLDGKPEFDRAASVGMMEHVRKDLQPGYFEAVFRVLKPSGVFMNHTIVSVWGARPVAVADRAKGRLWRRHAFIAKYVFPEGRLVPVSHVIASAERAGFELRDVESLREHYAMTLRHWMHGLEKHAEEAIRIAGDRNYRVWRMYMSAAAHGFANGRMNLVQALLVKPDKEGRSQMPLTRDYMYSERSQLRMRDDSAA
jgi:cyclopropane-fatty-acyl-phospholipid synthase